MLLKFCIVAFFSITFIFSADDSYESKGWTEGSVRHERDANLNQIKEFRKKMPGGEHIALSLVMAEWASHKAKTEKVDKKKYTSLAWEILNKATGFGWNPRQATPDEIAAMARGSVNVALTTNDDVESLWSNGTSKDKKYYDFLKMCGRAARTIGPKAPYLTERGLITWCRAPGVKNGDLVEFFEKVKLTKDFFTTKEFFANNLINLTGESEIYGWQITNSTRDILDLADGIIRKYDKFWSNGGTTLNNVKISYQKLREIKTKLKGELLEPTDPESQKTKMGYSTRKITKLTQVFALLDPNNFTEKMPQEGFNDDFFEIGNEKIETGFAAWKKIISSQPNFTEDLLRTSSLIDDMEVIIKGAGFGGQGVHKLDPFQKVNTRKMLELGRTYFNGHYNSREKNDKLNEAKDKLINDVENRLKELGDKLTAQCDTVKLTKELIVEHLGYILKGYKTGFTGAIESESGSDKITEAEWIEIISMIFDFSIKLDTYRINAGIDSTPYNLEFVFYQNIYENKDTGGGCVPGRKNRLLFRLANLLRQWIRFGNQLA